MHPSALRKLFLAYILCICFPSHTSFALQALDVALFGPTKKAFGAIFATWLWKEQVGATKWELLAIMYQAVLKAFTVTNIKSGFRATGLYPLNLDWCLVNQHKFAISAFLRKTASTEDTEPTKLTWRASERDSITVYENMICDFGSRSGRDLVANVRRFHLVFILHPLLVTLPCRSSSRGLLDSLDSYNMEQLQRIIDNTCAVRHKVMMERAVDSVFEIPEMSAERRAIVRGRRNAIDELHSEAKVSNIPIVSFETYSLIDCYETSYKPRSLTWKAGLFCSRRMPSKKPKRRPRKKKRRGRRSWILLHVLGKYSF